MLSSATKKIQQFRQSSDICPPVIPFDITSTVAPFNPFNSIDTAFQFVSQLRAFHKYPLILLIIQTKVYYQSLKKNSILNQENTQSICPIADSINPNIWGMYSKVVPISYRVGRYRLYQPILYSIVSL